MSFLWGYAKGIINNVLGYFIDKDTIFTDKCQTIMLIFNKFNNHTRA